MKRRILLALAGAFITWTGAASAAETLETVEKHIIDKAGQCKAIRFKNDYVQKMEMPQMKMQSQGQTTSEMKRDGNKWKYRTEGTSNSTMNMGQGEQKEKTTMLMVSDGEYVYTLTETNGQKSVTKTRAVEASILPDKAYFDNLRSQYKLELVGEEEVNGRATYVIRGSTEPQMPGMMSVMDNYFDKETGFVIKTVGKDAKGQTLLTSTSKDIEVNPKIDDDRFTFKAPEGVEVVDLTNQPGFSSMDEEEEADEE